MAPEAVIAALGGSVAAEELKGDYAAAAAAAAAALDAARAGGDPPALADAAIWAGIVSALRSQPLAAAARLEEALAAAPDHPLGPALRNFGHGASRRLPDGHDRPSQEAGAWPGPLTGDPLESELKVLTLLPAYRTTLQLSLGTPQPVQMIFDIALQTLEPLWDSRPHAHLAAAGLARTVNAQPLAEQHLEAATAGYAAVGDVAGLAGCDLARGAWAAVAAGTPLTFGLALAENPGSTTSERSSVLGRVLATAPGAAASAGAYERAEAGFRAAGAPRGVAMVELHRSAVAALHDDPAAALAAAERADAGFTAAGDLAAAQLAAAHAALAGVQAGAWPERHDVASRIGAWGRESGAVGWALGIGMLFSQAGWRWLRRDADPDRALACHRLADATFTALDEPAFAQQTLGDRAIAHDAAGNGDAARVAVDAAMRSFPELPPRHPEWADELELREGELANLARTLAYGGRDPDLLERVQPALDRFRARIEATGRGDGLEGMPAELRDPLMSQAVRTAQELAADREWDRAFAPLFRALAARRQNPLQYAAQLRLALEVAAGVPDERRGRLEANLLLGTGDSTAALRAFRDRPPAPRVPPDPREHAGLAVFLAQLGDWPAAREHFDAAERLAGRADWWMSESHPWLMAGDLARTAEGLGEHERARELYDAALTGIEGERARLARRGDHGEPGGAQAEASLFGDAARAALAAGPEAAGTAFALAERGRARGLLARMAGSAALATASDAQSADLLAWRELTARIDVLTGLAARSDGGPAPELAAAEDALGALEAKLAAENPRWLEAVSPPAAALDAAAVAAALPEGTLLIEHLLVGGGLLSWAITRDGPGTESFTPTDDLALDELQRKFWTACQGESPLWERFSRQLGDLLLAPFDEAIAASRHVVLVPHRWGHLAPGPALQWRGAPLVAAKPVTVLPSASALRFLPRSAPARGGPLLAVGDPDNMSRRRPGDAAPSGGFGALPWSGAQAAEAVGWFGGDPALLGAAAREQAVRERLAGARLVHFATHGVLDKAPLLSCIVLAEGDTLDVWELLGLSLDADLVTLSACDSAGAPITPGDELVGLAWLTLAAGARAVLASLWKVGELSTALVMRAFYGQLRDGRPPREALAAAQLHVRGLTRETAAPEIAALRAAAVAAGRPDPGEPADPPADFSHPFHWAGFVLVGV